MKVRGWGVGWRVERVGEWVMPPQHHITSPVTTVKNYPVVATIERHPTRVVYTNEADEHLVVMPLLHHCGTHVANTAFGLFAFGRDVKRVHLFTARITFQV